MRWFQFGLFSPIMRLHGSRLRTPEQPEPNPGIIGRSGRPNEIWCFGEKNYEIIKKLIETRERLRLYIMKHMDLASKTGSPLMRPMFYDYYGEATCLMLLNREEAFLHYRNEMKKFRKELARSVVFFSNLRYTI